MRFPRLIKSLATAALALSVAACGDADKGQLSSNQAEELLAVVDLAEKSLDAGGCQTVIRRAEEGIALVQEQNGVSVELQNNLIEGFERVRARTDIDCEPDDEPKESPTPEETPTEEPTEEPTIEETPTPEPTIEVTPEPTPTPEPTIEETPVPEPTDDTGSVLAPENEPDDR